MSTQSFWNQLEKPIIGLSPMDGVTDHPFRFIHKKYGQPAVMFTEFTSVEGVCHGAERLLEDFLYDGTQRPIIGQIYGTTPDFFRQTAIALCQLGFDGIDINMGCPAKNVAHSGAGAALIKTPDLAQKIIRDVQSGIEQWHNGATCRDCPDLRPSICQEIERRAEAFIAEYPDLETYRSRTIPVSVKTRVGFDQPVIQEWIPNLLECEPATITLHGRTLKQQYGGSANWDLIAEAGELAHQTDTLLLGNGDVTSLAQAREYAKKYKLDGTLLGRAAMGNPWVFNCGDTSQRFRVAIEHSELYEQTYSHLERYSFMPMRKHLGWYVKDIPNAAQIRIELFQANTSEEVAVILRKYELI
jgi:tRNA-dihydrouridine synthase B